MNENVSINPHYLVWLMERGVEERLEELRQKMERAQGLAHWIDNSTRLKDADSGGVGGARRSLVQMFILVLGEMEFIAELKEDLVNADQKNLEDGAGLHEVDEDKEIGL